LPLALNATLGGDNAYAGVHAPDVVGNIRIDQAWGLLQISRAAHEVNDSAGLAAVRPHGGDQAKQILDRTDRRHLQFSDGLCDLLGVDEVDVVAV